MFVRIVRELLEDVIIVLRRGVSFIESEFTNAAVFTAILFRNDN